MFIRAIDEALEALVRTRLPLPESVGDVAFEAPGTKWSAQLSRITVNLFLYGVSRSSHPVRSATVRVNGDQTQLRRPQPMIDLDYLVTTWAGSAREEQQLLGDLVSILAGLTELPAELFSTPPPTSASLDIDADPLNKVREVLSAVGGELKSGLQLRVSVGADAFDWHAAPPPVERIETLMAPNMSRRFATPPVAQPESPVG